MQQELDDILETICQKDERYDLEAYEFVLEALTFTQKKYKSEKHVSGKELLEGIKVFSLRKFGPMTLTVLKYWGINSTEDFGNMVFNLVNYRVLSKTEEDHIDHFKNVFDFDMVFEKGYRRSLAKKIARLR